MLAWWQRGSYHFLSSGSLFFKLLGKAWGILRIFLFPLFLLFRLISVPHEIHYGAEIGKGLKILHPSLGIVISKYAVIGENLTITGGNCIGGRKSLAYGDLVLGNNIQLGANAVVLGPVRVGDHTKIGANALVIHDSPGNEVLVGVPAHPVTQKIIMSEQSSKAA